MMSAVARTLKLAIAAAAPLAMSWGGVALAACPPPDTLPALFEVKGPLNRIDAVAGTARVRGVTIEIPDNVLVRTGGASIPLADLADNATAQANGGVLNYQRGILRALGRIVPSAGGCSYVADRVFFKFGEDVLRGLLTAVDLSAGINVAGNTFNESFEVNGQTVVMNKDPRVPASLRDSGGTPLEVADLVDDLGAKVDVQGYFHPSRNILFGTQVNVSSDVDTVDTVTITRAEFRADRREFEVRGQVRPVGAPSVDVFPNGVIDQVSGGCTAGNLPTFTNVPLIPNSSANRADFRVRARPLGGQAIPTTVCVESAGGGVAQSNVSRQ